MESPKKDGDLVELKKFEPIPQDVLELLPESLIRKNMVVPLAKRDGRLLAAIPNVKNVIKPAGLAMVVGCPVDLVTVPIEQIIEFIKGHFDGTPEPKEKPKPITAPEKRADKKVEPSISPDSRPVEPPRKLFPSEIQKWLEGGLREGATEVLIHCDSGQVIVRYRVRGIVIDGKESPELSIKDFDRLVNALKEVGVTYQKSFASRTEFSGRIQHDSEPYHLSALMSESGDLRLITFRLAPFRGFLYNPSEWGMSKKNHVLLEKLLARRQGVVLFCGSDPDEVTRVYSSCLKKVVQSTVRVLSIDNYIFDDIPGVDQMVTKGSVETQASLLDISFRHSPDVIAVNPLQTQEAYSLCLKNTLQGPLVLGVDYARDSAGLVSKILAMGVDSYVLESGLIGIVAVQKVRLICPDCKERDVVPRDVIRGLNIPYSMRPSTFYRGKGCKKCCQTGYGSDSCIYEVLEFTDEVKALLDRKVSASELRSRLKTRSFTGFRQSAIHLAINGKISLEEASRVIPS